MSNTLLVVRGHIVGNIPGVREVVCNDILTMMGMLSKDYITIDKVLIENSQVHLKQAREHSNGVDRVIYLGGTALMWYKLRHLISHKLNYEKERETYKIYRPFKHTIHSSVLGCMILDKKYKNGQHITAIYGASPYVNMLAVQRYIDMPSLRGSMRLSISNVELIKGIDGDTFHKYTDVFSFAC